MARLSQAVAEHIVALREAETSAAAKLQRAREAVNEACARFLDTGAEEDRLARVAADEALQRAKADYDAARETCNKAGIVAARDLS